jgi:hypothetical protein
MNRATKLALLVLLFAVSSRAQTSPGPAGVDFLPDRVQPAGTARNIFAQPILDTRDVFLFKDKTESILAVAQGLFLVSDGIVTRSRVQNGASYEGNPVVSFLTGTHPTWGRMAPLGAAQEVVGIWLGTEMKRSRNRFVRKVWWLPQAVGIGGNLSGTAYGILTR